MPTQLKRLMIVGMSLFFLGQCAWFNKDKSESVLIKPKPIDGYEALGTRIHYPRSVREEGIEGTVAVSALISERGIVTDTRITQTLHPKLDKIAANALKRTMFSPALSDNVPTSVWISVPFVFTLSEWKPRETPFKDFSMTIKPSPSYKNYDVVINGSLKEGTSNPLRVECLLPINADNSWVKSEGEVQMNQNLFHDDNGEWLVFNMEDQKTSWGFTYKPLDENDFKKFRYEFALNQALPEWDLRIVYGEQNIRFSQEPDRLILQDDGDTRFEYVLNPLSAYESRFLEIELQTQITGHKDDKNHP